MENPQTHNHLPPSWPSSWMAETHPRRPLHPPESSVPNPLIVAAQVDETLENSLARLSLSDFRDEPSYQPPSLNGGVIGAGMPVLRSSITDYFNADGGFFPPSLPDDVVGSVGNIGLEDHWPFPLMGSCDYRVWDSYLLNSAPPNGVFGDSVSDLGLISEDTNGFKHTLGNQNQGPRFAQDLNINYPPLNDLRGKIVSLAMDQYGCRFLQAKFSDISKEEIEMIFMEVIDHVGVLMVDPFGNYLFQKLVETCSDEQRSQILVSVTRLERELFAICLNMHGTRSVQKLLDHLTTQPQVTLAMSVLSRGAAPLSMDNNGHHVIKHCLQSFPYDDIKYLLNEVANNCFVIATDRSGCCVVQSCVEHSRAECRERLVAEITANALPLAEDCYGNYVVQYLLEMKIPRVVTNLLRQFKGRYVSLSCNKFASNVVEKCLVQSRREQSEQIIVELLRSPNVSILLLDPFGNYVIQTALSVSEGFVSNALRNLVRMHSSSMRNNQYGKKIIAWFEKRKLQYVH